MSDGQTLCGSWTGRFDYDNVVHGTPVSFDATITQTGASLSGETVEPNTFRPEPTDTLLAVIVGERSGTAVSFEKIYTDFDAPEAPVYEGRVNITATRITGRWHFRSMPSVTGTFLLARTTMAATRKTKRAEAAMEMEFDAQR